VRAAIDGLTWVTGRDLGAEHLDAMDRYYRATVDDHGGHDYLRPGFFHRLAERMPEELAFAEVRAGGARVAGAIFFETAHGLYGRYWGSDRHIDLLHFETAYYAGIDRCIERKLPLFEAGAQGEHKLLRGFEPTRTYSAHWFRDPRFGAAIGDFLEREHVAVAAHMKELADAGPYRAQDSAPGSATDAED
jgi:predicted N-acyltransferase